LKLQSNDIEKPQSNKATQLRNHEMAMLQSSIFRSHTASINIVKKKQKMSRAIFQKNLPINCCRENTTNAPGNKNVTK
jgi:CRISPR/Cas system-associated endoribonuclease Cas2